jgi:hypothetical protein
LDLWSTRLIPKASEHENAQLKRMGGTLLDISMLKDQGEEW